MKPRVPPARIPAPLAQANAATIKAASHVDDATQVRDIASVSGDAATATKGTLTPESHALELTATLMPPPYVSEQGGGTPGVPGVVLQTAPLSAKIHTSENVTRAAKDVAFCARVDGKIRKNATAIVAKSALAQDLDDDGRPIAGVEVDAKTGRPRGWTARDLNVAKDWRKPVKQQPGYLAAQTRILESYKRAEANVPAAPVLNAEVVQVHVDARTYNYRVVDVTDHEKG